MKRYDMVVIGGGNAGLAAAYGVAGAKRHVALVDKGPVGGLCSLAGCNPKKVFVRAAEMLDHVRHAGEHGITAREMTIDWERVWRRKHSFTDPVPQATEASLASSGVERIRGMARFGSQQTMIVNDEEVHADGFTIATGSHPRKLTFPGAELVSTTNDVLEIRTPPERMVIIGAGVVAFEFSHVFARLGTKVTVLMHGKRALGGFDDDFADAALEFTRTLGVDFIHDAKVNSVTQTSDGLRVSFDRAGDSDIREAQFVLNAAGRDAAIEELDLTRANVDFQSRGILVNEFLRSRTNAHVFAAGDAHGTLQLSPIAWYEGSIIARNFLEGDVLRVDYSSVPQSVFTIPPLSRVGLTESEARAAGHDVVVRTEDMTKWKVYAIAGVPIARAKVILDKPTKRILGVQLLGEASSENIHLFALAIRYGLTATDMQSMVYAYPTFASAIPSLFG